jgi:hypothetical protein
MGATSYAGGAQASALSSNINNSSTGFQVTATVGWPNTSVGPFYAKIDPGLSGEEKILISAYDGSGNLTVTSRGADGTSASSHNQGAVIQPCWDAVSAQDDNNHIYVTTRNDHTQYLTATALDGGSNYHDKTSRHAFGAALGTPGSPVSVWNTGASAGSASGPARSDHKHLGIPIPPTSGYLLFSTGNGAGNVAWDAPTYGVIDGTSGDITTISTNGNTGAAGSVGQAADAGHQHPYVGEMAGGYNTYNATTAGVVGECALFYGLSGDATYTLPTAASATIGQKIYIIDANTVSIYFVVVTPHAGDHLYNNAGNGVSGYVGVPQGTSSIFMKVNSNSWAQIA